jgi:hypothetical protein
MEKKRKRRRRREVNDKFLKIKKNVILNQLLRFGEEEREVNDNF